MTSKLSSEATLLSRSLLQLSLLIWLGRHAAVVVARGKEVGGVASLAGLSEGALATDEAESLLSRTTS